MLLERAQDAMTEIKKAVMGKDDVIAKVLMALLAQGHVLLEDYPGVGKTTLALAFSNALGLSYHRIQFTPETMPADVLGYTLIDRGTGKPSFSPGGVFCNLLLADEINRTSAKTQSALLQAMEESQVTVDGITHPLPNPFGVIATQNPYGSAGTQLLPESQMDRFMVRLSMGYPDEENEIKILRQTKGAKAVTLISPITSPEELVQMQLECEEVYIAHELFAYAVHLAAFTRTHPMVALGASPRAGTALIRMARACAWLNGRDYVVPRDVKALLPDVFGHRLQLLPAAKAQGVTIAEVFEELHHKVPEPRLIRR